MGRGFARYLRRGAAFHLNWLALPALISAGYQIVALIAAARKWKGRALISRYAPPISILKPIHGGDPQLYEALVSHATQRYPEFEILFGVRDPRDPALPEILRLASEYPEVRMRVITNIEQTANGKVGALAALAAEARHAILLVNDSDIAVAPDYLSTVVAPLQDANTGLVTCLYRARSSSFPARFEALGIATDFAPSVLVARLLGVAEFALGSTMVFRADDLRRVGGFESLQDYLADDYQLGLRITQLGLRVVFADAVVETNLGAGSWSDAWKHQVRWSRTIRVSRPGGYYGYIATQTTFWAIVAWCAGARRIAAIALAFRMAAGIAAGSGVLRDRHTARDWWLIPFRDLFGTAVWTTGLFGDTVEWRGDRLVLSRDGRITRHPLG